MTIKVGDRLPAGTLSRIHRSRRPTAAPIGPNQFKIDDLTAARRS